MPLWQEPDVSGGLLQKRGTPVRTASPSLLISPPLPVIPGLSPRHFRAGENPYGIAVRTASPVYIISSPCYSRALPCHYCFPGHFRAGGSPIVAGW